MFQHPTDRGQASASTTTTTTDSLQRLTWAGMLLLLLAMAIATGSAQANAGTAPDQLVEHTTGQLLSALQHDREQILKHPEHIFVLTNDIVLPHVDFEAMSASVLGKYWRTASTEQKQRFPQEFRNLLLRTYATALNEYTDEKIVILPLRDDPASGDVTVNTEIQRSTGPAIPVSYSLHKVQENWMVYDIKIDGISLVANYRTSFAAQIRRYGIDGLIDKLVEKHSSLASNQ